MCELLSLRQTSETVQACTDRHCNLLVSVYNRRFFPHAPKPISTNVSVSDKKVLVVKNKIVYINTNKKDVDWDKN